MIFMSAQVRQQLAGKTLHGEKRVSIRVDFMYSAQKESELPSLASFKRKHLFPGHKEKKDTNNLAILFLSDKQFSGRQLSANS